MAAKNSFMGHNRGLYKAIKRCLADKYDQQVLDEIRLDILQSSFMQGDDGEGVIGMQSITIVKYNNHIIDFIVSKYWLSSEKYSLERFTHADMFYTYKEK